MTDQSANSDASPGTAEPRGRGRPRDPSLDSRRRGEILAAAGRVFASSGYAGADMGAIAVAAGVGKGTLYRYFARKDALFLAALDHALTDLAECVSVEVVNTTLPLRTRLFGVVRVYLAFFAARPEVVELFVQERASFRGREQALYFSIGHDDPRHARLDGFMVELFASGLLRPMSPEQFECVVGDLLFGTVVTNTLSGRPHDPEAQALAVWKLLECGLFQSPPESP